MNTPISGDEDIDQSILDFIKYAVMAPSADNSQPWRFDIGKESIRCRYSHAGAAEDIFGELGHASILSAGALQETIDHLLGLIDMQPSTAELSDSWRIDFEVPIKQLPICDALRAVEERHTNRFPYKAVPDSTVDDFLGWSLDGVRVNVIRDRAQISEMGRAVRLCSEARFNSKLLHEWLFSSLRWSKDEVMAGDGLDLNCVDLPPGGRAFMHFI